MCGYYEVCGGWGGNFSGPKKARFYANAIGRGDFCRDVGYSRYYR